jgi:hypothetical protein
MISRPPRIVIQSMASIASFYHASVSSPRANQRDFFNTHRRLHSLRTGRPYPGSVSVIEIVRQLNTSHTRNLTIFVTSQLSAKRPKTIQMKAALSITPEYHDWALADTLLRTRQPPTRTSAIRMHTAQHTPIANPTEIANTYPTSPVWECFASADAPATGTTKEMSVSRSHKVTPPVWCCSDIQLAFMFSLKIRTQGANLLALLIVDEIRR